MDSMRKCETLCAQQYYQQLRDGEPTGLARIQFPSDPASDLSPRLRAYGKSLFRDAWVGSSVRRLCRRCRGPRWLSDHRPSRAASLGPRCAIATATAAIRVSVEHPTIANVSRDRAQKIAPPLALRPSTIPRNVFGYACAIATATAAIRVSVDHPTIKVRGLMLAKTGRLASAAFLIRSTLAFC
jgi:hypothetical protein